MGASSPRQTAFRILRRVEQQGAYSSLLLQQIDSPGLQPRDVALVTELVYGVLRRRLYLDYVLAAYSKRPLDAIHPDLRLVLRMALYQIFFLDRVPPHALVNESVEMARRNLKGRGASAASFANGLLRAVTRDLSRAPAPPSLRGASDPAAALSISESHPQWLVRRWMDQLGTEEAALLLAAQNRPAPVALRVNRRVASPEEVGAALATEWVMARPSRFLSDVLVVTQGVPQHTRSFRRGEFYIQDEASGLVACLAEAAEGDTILDACAAPGGKALALADKVGDRGLIVAGDLHPARLGLVRDNARRLKLRSCVMVAGDFGSPDLPLVLDLKFDSVLVDAPCSGTGVIRRHPELRYRVSPEQLHRLPQTQARLLESGASRVRAGGILVYSVCSLEPEEGPEQVERFLGGHPGFTLEDPRAVLPEQARSLVSLAGGGGFLITLPHRDDLDGFFAARLKRQR